MAFKQSLVGSALAASLLSTGSLAGWYDGVPQMIRNVPYEALTPGVADRWRESRRDIMLNRGVCESGKTVFLDMNGRHLGETSRVDSESPNPQNQRRIDRWRIGYEREEDLDVVVSRGYKVGYPFAYSCDDDNEDFIRSGVEYYYGGLERITTGWGSYEVDDPISVREAFRTVEEAFPSLPDSVGMMLRAQSVLESGGDRYADSGHAYGLMQITPDNLRACGVARGDWEHELAQIHCAYDLTSRNAERLQEPFENLFGRLPEEKQERLFTNLLAHAYHAGVEHFVDMMGSGSAGNASKYYRDNHGRYSADDITFGLLFHNYGAKSRGFGALRSASLKYSVDARVAQELLAQEAQERGVSVR